MYVQLLLPYSTIAITVHVCTAIIRLYKTLHPLETSQKAPSGTFKD